MNALLLLDNPLLFASWVLTLLAGLTLHEYAHAVAARAFGDITPAEEGRLTLNPLAHIDLWGLALLAIIGFGWGKPVNFDPYALKFRRLGAFVVSLAGPLVNALLALGSVWGVRYAQSAYGLDAASTAVEFLMISAAVNAVLAVFNLLPIPPLDGANLILDQLPMRWDRFRLIMQERGHWVLFAILLGDRLSGFNLFPKLFELPLVWLWKAFGLS